MAEKPPSMKYAVREALKALSVTEVDRAAVALARRYAAEIDREPDALAKFGPSLLSVLESLGMTPKSRRTAANKGGQDDGDKRDPLDELRARRANRARVH